MGFTTPCFIRKNTPEIKKRLEDLGYKPFGSVKYEWDLGFGLSTDNRLGEFESFDNNSLENIIKCKSPDYEDSIDCGDNEVLFLAVAALRDDTDYMQWFIFENPGLYDDYPEKIWVYIFEENELEKYRKECIKLNKPILSYHKATVEELIEHFKK